MVVHRSGEADTAGMECGEERELQLPVRIGIATGEAELREGDYFGTVLNRAAKLR